MLSPYMYCLITPHKYIKKILYLPMFTNEERRLRTEAHCSMWELELTMSIRELWALGLTMSIRELWALGLTMSVKEV